MSICRRDVLINAGKVSMVVAIGCGDLAFAEEGKFCVDCVHYRPIRGGKIWYDRYCGRVENVKVKHPVTGELTYIPGYNALGQIIYSDQQYPYARDLNGRGQCKNFEAKP